MSNNRLPPEQGLGPRKGALPGVAGGAGPKRKSVLAVAVHDRSWGRTQMAVRAAYDLREAGYRVELLIHEATKPLLEGGPFAFKAVSNHIGGLFRVILDAEVARLRPSAIVYFDFFNTANLLRRLGIPDPGFLVGYDCLTASLDTWDSSLTGHMVDLPDGQTRSLMLSESEQALRAFAQIPHRFIPVPVASCDGRRGKYRCLPQQGPKPDPDVRDELGFAAHDRLVLFPTAPWQSPDRLPQSARGLSEVLPMLLAECLSTLGSRVHLLHVGPQASQMTEEYANYHWMPSCPASRFNSLLAAADLMVTGNVAATTIVTAMTLKTPLLVVRNSRLLLHEEHLEELEGTSGLCTRQLSERLPLYPFSLWPLGYRDFLSPILGRNEYCESFDWTELLPTSKFVERIDGLLYSPITRSRMWRKQSAYLKEVSALPSAGELMTEYLN